MSSILPFTDIEKNTINIYANDGIGSAYSRAYICIKTLPKDEQTDVVNQYASNFFPGFFRLSLASSLTYAGIGGTLGLLFGGAPGLVSGMKIGGDLGMTVGFLGGLYVGEVSARYHFERSNSYKKWVCKARENDIYSIYQNIIQNDERFDRFVCMHTVDLITMPVKAPDGQIYEQEAIEMWIDKKEKELERCRERGGSQEELNEISMTISYVRACGFTKTDLIYHPQYFKSLDSLVKLKISEMEKGVERKVFKEATKNILKAQQENHASIQQLYEQEVNKINKYVVDNALDTAIARKVAADLRKKFGIES